MASVPGNGVRASIRLERDAGSGVEAIQASFAAHAYDMHRHDDWLIGVTDHGIQDFHCGGTRHRSIPGCVILIEPQEAHDGQSGGPEGFAYSMLYLPPAWLRSALGDPRESGFASTLVEDHRLGAAIRHATAILGQRSDRLSAEEALATVVELSRPHLGCRTDPTTRFGTIARRARERLHEAITEDIGEDALARDAGAANRFHLARAFRAAYGTSPHAYLVQLRLLRARSMLAGGEPPAAVAAFCGFADQSHFGRWFRRAYGVTPAHYRWCCTGVPDKSRPVC